MNVADIVSLLDRKYSGADAVPCPQEGTPVKSQTGKVFSEHGNLAVHASGGSLVCGRCGYNQPVGRP